MKEKETINNSDIITRESLEEAINHLEQEYKLKQNNPNIPSHQFYHYQSQLYALCDLKRKLEGKYKKV